LGAPIVHTDDFASWEEPLEWWPRLLEQVLVPLAEGNAARYQRYDWTRHQLGEWVDLESDMCVVLEGVSAGRVAFRPYLSFVIWVETPRDVCLARGLERDGADMLSDWERWIADEDRYIERESPERYADLVVAGTPTIEHDPDREVVVLRERTEA
jgi:uridine kinase